MAATFTAPPSRRTPISTPSPAAAPSTPNSHNHFLPTAADFITRLRADYPQFVIKIGPRFKFRPPRTIILNPSESYFDPDSGKNRPYPLQYFALLSLHELGHALCKHKDYTVIVERLKIESAAWQRAKTILIRDHPEYQSDFDLTYDEDFAEAQLDTYRDWLHAKSKCPRCGLTRYQTPDRRWHCPRCDLL